MKKLLILLLSLIMFNALQASDIPLKIEPKSPKINPQFEEKLRLSDFGEKTKIWIYFTDKGITDNNSLKTTLRQIENIFSDRSINRRVNRTKSIDTFDFYDLPVYQNYIQALESIDLEIIRQSRWLNAVSVYTNYESIKLIQDMQFVAEIKPVLKAKRSPAPDVKDDTPSINPKPSLDLPVNWYGESYDQLDLINVPLMHYLGYTGETILIALFDTGFDLDHPVFDSINIIADSAFIDDTLIYEGHGTATLSVIGGRADSILVGSAYEADFMVASTEVQSYENETEEDNWVAAAEWADIMGADIISSSVGYFEWYDFSDLDGNTAVITIAADIAASRGIAVFNSAGNERGDPQYYFNHITPPADGNLVMAVGAVTGAGALASFSSPGPSFDGRIKPDIVAMGVGVYSAYPPTGYSFSSGTSFACPLSAGAAALLLQIHPDWSPEDLYEAMISSADRYNNPDNDFGYGIFNTFRAAGLFEFDLISPIRLAIGDSLNLTVSVSGQDTGFVSFTAFNLPDSLEFTPDSINGIVNLKYKARYEDLGTREIRFTANSGLMAASATMSFTVFANPDIIAGPNPFSDSVTIFLGTEAGRLKNISIYSVNGEKVWDDFSDSYNEEAGTVVWQGINNSSRTTAAGVYLILVETERTTQKIKVFKNSSP